GPGMEVLRARELLADQRAADDLATHCDERAVRPPRKEQLCHAGHDAGIDHAREHDQHERDDDRRAQLVLEHAHRSLSATSSRSMTLIPMKGMRMPPTP